MLLRLEVKYLPKLDTEASIDDVVEIRLIHPGDHPDFVIDYLSSKLWMDRQSAQHLVRAGYGVINQKVSRKRANAEVVLMKSLGMEVEVVEVGKRKSGSLFDVSVRRTRRSSLTEIQRELKSLGFLSKVKAADFKAPSGLEICGLSHRSSMKYAKRLQKIEGVTVTICPQTAALFDVMTPPGLTRVKEAEIHEFAVAMGCGAISGHGMLATGLTRDDFSKLVARFPNAQMVSANRAFERIDLFVTGLGTINIEDLLKFSARYGLDAARAVSAGERYRIETGLSRPEARLVFEWLILTGLEFRAESSVG